MITKVKISGYRTFRLLEFSPNNRINLIVGGNESGKSTLLEAIALALTGRINGRRASEELNPYWFNIEMVREFVAARKRGELVAFPTIHIEVFLEDRQDLQSLCGAVNSEVPATACPGISMKIQPNSEYSEEMEAWADNPSHILPIEYYVEEWRDFGDNIIMYRPKQLCTAVIDSRTVRSTSGIDYHLREILGAHLEPAERAAISLAYRQVKVAMSESSLKEVNTRIAGVHASIHDRPISLAMDQTARTSWEGAITPHVQDVPFSMSGQGQQASVKIALAMNRQNERANIVMVEEPENHLSHTTLTKLIARIETLQSEQQQLFLTTHSSFVLNRLGIGSLLLIGGNAVSKIPDLAGTTVTYFQKLPGYDTLRMVLAEKIVLVEGASDEIVFERVFRDLFDKTPMEAGIDVISMRGLSLARCLELCAVLDKQVAALRDNDGHEPADLRTPLEKWLANGRRDLFIGDIEHGETLEPQLIHFNDEGNLRTILGITERADLLTWMTREKTEGALRIAASESRITAPEYMRRAAEFIHG